MSLTNLIGREEREREMREIRECEFTQPRGKFYFSKVSRLEYNREYTEKNNMLYLINKIVATYYKQYY